MPALALVNDLAEAQRSEEVYLAKENDLKINKKCSVISKSQLLMKGTKIDSNPLNTRYCRQLTEKSLLMKIEHQLKCFLDTCWSNEEMNKLG